MGDRKIEKKYCFLMMSSLFMIGTFTSLLIGVLLWLVRELVVQHELLVTATEMVNYDWFLILIIFLGFPLGSLLSVYLAVRFYFRIHFKMVVYLFGFLFSIFGVSFMFILNLILETVSFYALVPMGNDILILLFPMISSFGLCVVLCKNLSRCPNRI